MLQKYFRQRTHAPCQFRCLNTASKCQGSTKCTYYRPDTSCHNHQPVTLAWVTLCTMALIVLVCLVPWVFVVFTTFSSHKSTKRNQNIWEHLQHTQWDCVRGNIFRQNLFSFLQVFALSTDIIFHQSLCNIPICHLSQEKNLLTEEKRQTSSLQNG